MKDHSDAMKIGRAEKPGWAFAKRALATATVALSMCQTPLFAWNGTGHRVVAAVAYQELPPASRAKAVELLKNHPRYQDWKNSFVPSAGKDLGLHLFMQASVWPDDIRKSGDPFDHPNWHYVGYPLRAPNFEFQPAPAPDNDILYGLKKSRETLQNTRDTQTERAAALSWLIHLVGDLHQPLHCSTLFSKVFKTRQGDRGGNFFFIKETEDSLPQNLHEYWDGLINSPQREPVVKQAANLKNEYPRQQLQELQDFQTADEWSKESRKIAIECAYWNGGLHEAKEGDQAQKLPEGYVDAARLGARRRGALAGYRLSDEISKVLP